MQDLFCSVSKDNGIIMIRVFPQGDKSWPNYTIFTVQWVLQRVPMP